MRSAIAALTLISVLPLSAATRIDDPKAFVTDVYRRFMARSSYVPPEDVYTPRLEKLVREDKRKSKGEVGCIDFVFWLNAQDWKITNLMVTASDAGPDRQMVTTKFRNFGEPQEMHFDFVRVSGRWLLDDAHSVSAPPWTLSELLKCAP
jgi:hypothetical protein